MPKKPFAEQHLHVTLQRAGKKVLIKKSVKQIIFVTFRKHLLPSFFPLIIQYLLKQNESVYTGSPARF